ncbi:MAG: hypothetical protein F6K24_33610 [Okeania sp. SIO2D1]|nr:hypothetical protein [Okeania sp. SIO2D1]
MIRCYVEYHPMDWGLSANHNIIIYDIEPAWQAEIQQILDQSQILPLEKLDPLVRYSMACPAFPTCGLAIAESERALPGITERIRTLLAKLGMEKEHFVIRMTGCPNGCARPYMAELGFVGSLPKVYQVWLGGTPDQTKLARPYTDKLAIADLEAFLEPLFVYFKENRHQEESFGLFCDRVGFEALREFSKNYQRGSDQEEKPRKHRHRIGVPEEVYYKLKEASAQQGRPMSQIVTEALREFFGSDDSVSQDS